MKRGWKIFLIILAILILLIVAFASLTIYQIKQIYNLASDPELNKDIVDLTKGNCSKLQVLEPKLSQIQISLKSYCINPVIKALSKKIRVYNMDICAEIISPENKIQQLLNQAKTMCK